MRRILYAIAGTLALITGLIGVVLPVLPTTPFLLLSAWCFARSNKRLHSWLINHKHFGPAINDWEKHKGIKASNKKRAYVLIVLSFSISIYVVPLTWVKVLLFFMCIALLWNMKRIKTL